MQTFRNFSLYIPTGSLTKLVNRTMLLLRRSITVKTAISYTCFVELQEETNSWHSRHHVIPTLVHVGAFPFERTAGYLFLIQQPTVCTAGTC
jgi:hypothetical protein